MTKDRAAERRYRRRWKSKEVPSFTEWFACTKNLNKEIDAEIVVLLQYKGNIEKGAKPYGRHRPSRITRVVKELRELNDERCGVSQKEALSLRRDRDTLEREIKITWQDLTPEQYEFIVSRLEHRLSMNEQALVAFINEGLRKGPKTKGIEQRNAVRTNLKHIYDSDVREAETRNVDFLNLEIAEGSNVSYGAFVDTSGDPTQRSYRRFGYERHTPLGEEAKDARKSWLKRHEEAKSKTTVVYTFLPFLFLIFGAFIFILFLSKAQVKMPSNKQKVVREGF